MGVGFGTSSRKIDGIQAGGFFGQYSARIACGVELFTYSDVRIYLGVDVSLPFGTNQGSWTGIVTDPTTGKSTVETRTVQGKSQYVDLSLKIGF
jgi:hypothetical protein